MYFSGDKKPQDFQIQRQTTSLRSLPKIETLLFLPKINDLSLTKQSKTQNNLQLFKNQQLQQQYSGSSQIINDQKQFYTPLDSRPARGIVKKPGRAGSSYGIDIVEDIKQDDLVSLSEQSNISSLSVVKDANNNNNCGQQMISPMNKYQIIKKSTIPENVISTFSASPQPGSATDSIKLAENYQNNNSNLQQNPSTSTSSMNLATLTKNKLVGSSSSQLLKDTKQSTSVAQLQLAVDQNRLDFMLEKGLNFERTSQLSKVQQENKEYKQALKKSETEVKRLKEELDYLKSVNQQLQAQNLHASYLQTHGNQSSSLEEQYWMMEKKIQQNEYFKQQLVVLKAASEKEIIELRQVCKELEHQLEREKQINKLKLEEEDDKINLNGVLITDVVGLKGSQKKIATIVGENQEIKQGDQIQQQQGIYCPKCMDQESKLQIDNKILSDELQQFRQLRDNLEQESTNLREILNSNKVNATHEKQRYEKYIQEQTEELLQADKASRELRVLYEKLLEKIKQLKNSSEFEKITFRNEFTIIKTEELNMIERFNSEKTQIIKDFIEQKSNLEKQISNQVIQIKSLTDQVSSLNLHIEWLKKRGTNQNGSQNGTLNNYLGLSEEILKLKKAIDEKITVIPENKNVSEFESKLEEMEKINSQMVKQINQLANEEANSRKTIQSIPVLQQFEDAQVKVEKHIKCASCEGILDKAITCVPCGHNFCKKCHYDQRQKGKSSETVACKKCGPSTMIYANESLDELIGMFNLMKSAKEVMKLYLRQA